MSQPRLDARSVSRDSLSALLENTPEALQSLGRAEDYTRQDYTDRFVFELLQNARDAAARHATRDPRVLLRVAGDALLVANDGAPFDLQGYRALTAIGRSTKRGRFGAGGEALIGRKGIGFKSVLRISTAPAVFGNTADGRLCLAFGRPPPQVVEAALRGDPSSFSAALDPFARAELARWLDGTGRTHIGTCSLPTQVRATGGPDAWATLPRDVPAMMFPRWVADEDVPPAVRELLGWGTGEGPPYTTVVYLPLDPSRADEVREKLETDVVSEKVLFLGVLGQVRVERNSGFARVITADWSRRSNVTLSTEDEGHPTVHRRYRVFRRQVAVPGDQELREVRVAVPVDDAGRVEDRGRFPLFNYYPIVDEGPHLLPVLAHAEFEVDPGRKSLSDDHRALNEVLVDAMAELLTGDEGIWSAVVRTGELDGRRLMPGLLVPSVSDRGLPRLLHDRVLERLRSRPCVPVRGGWAVAASVVFGEPPVGDALRRLSACAPGLRVPETDRLEGLAALGARTWDTEALGAVLEEIDTSSCRDAGPFRDLVEVMRAVAPPKGWAAFLEPWSVGGRRPAAIVPCLSTTGGGVEGAPPPRRLKSGGQTEQAKAWSRAEDALYLRTGSAAGVRVPPASMRVRFVIDDPFEGTAPDWQETCETFFGVHRYEPTQILEQLRAVSEGADWQEVADFVLRFLREEKREPWRLQDYGAPAVRPQDTFAGAAPRHHQAARIGLACLRLPDRDGRLRAGPDLRFDASWGPAYDLLDAFAPPSAVPLAPPEALGHWLGGVDVSEAMAFGRLCGVWETAPVGWFDEQVEGVALGPAFEERMPDAPHREWARALSARSWRFGRTFPHRNVKVARTVWLRDLPSGDPARSRALLALLDRDWAFFGSLGETELFCPSCRGPGGGWNHGRDNCGREASPPVALRAVLADHAWYHRSRAEGDAVPIRDLVRVESPPAPENLHNSRWQFLPHLRTRVEAESVALRGLGLTSIGGKSREDLLRLLSLLRTVLETDRGLHTARGGPRRAAFEALHREELYPRMAELVPERPVPPEFAARLDAVGWLVESDTGLRHVPASEAFVDRGTDPVGRTRFRQKALFHVVDRGAELTRSLGAPEFVVEAKASTIAPVDRSAAFHAAVEAALPEVVALMSRVVPGGGRPADVEEAAFGERLARLRSLRFVHCEDLSVDLAVAGPPSLAILGVGSRRRRDRFLDLVVSPPTLWFDHPLDDDDGPEGLLPELAGELARALDAPAYGPLFALLFQSRDDRRRAWLEDLGVTEDDRERAERVVGSSSDHRRALLLLLADALAETAPDPDPGAAPSALAPLLLEPGSLERGGEESALGQLARAGWRLEALSAALQRRGLEGVHVRDHERAMRSWNERHRHTLEALLRRAGVSEVPAALRAAFGADPHWRFRPVVGAEELGAGLRRVLDEAGYVGVPVPGLQASSQAWQQTLAEALGTPVTALFSSAVDDGEERSQRLARDRQRWLPVLVAVVAGDGGSDGIRAVYDAATEAVRACALEASAVAWLVGRGLSPARAERVAQELLAEVRDDEAGRVGAAAGLEDLPDRLRRVRRVLDEKRTKRLGELDRARKALPEAPLREITPAAGAVVTAPGPSSRALRRRIRAGAVSADQAERRRNARLGERGEDVAFRQVAAELLALRAAADDAYPVAVRALLGWLCAFDLEEGLAARFSAHAADALDPAADEEDVLLALEGLLHVSGDRGSDEFGFDLVGWDPTRRRPVALEVKTSTALGAEFHLSARQWAVAEGLGDDFVVLRVALVDGRPAERIALRNPTRLSREVLAVHGETWLCKWVGG